VMNACIYLIFAPSFATTIVGDSMDDVPPSFANSAQPPKGIGMDRKSKFSERIFRLNGMELGHVITTIETKCPQALQDLPSSLVEINVDALPPPIFMQLEAYLQERVPNTKRRKVNS